MKKITNKTRVKVSSFKLFQYLDLEFWHINAYSSAFKYLYDNFDLRCTSKRVGVFYFSIGDKAKYSLFLLKHSDLLRSKN
jgi:hypothetical protein